MQRLPPLQIRRAVTTRTLASSLRLSPRRLKKFVDGWP